MEPNDRLETFLRPLQVDEELAHRLSWDFFDNFTYLADSSPDQFLPTPISESLLRPVTTSRTGHGRHFAIDIGGTNLRVGFVELQAKDGQALPPRRHFERSWPILDHLKNENADSLFAWIGECIAEVLREAHEPSDASRTGPEVPMGITFSFPMDQTSISNATLRSMGKGFAIRDGTDLASSVLKGYAGVRAANPDLPGIRIAAITNDSVSTLISFKYSFPETHDQQAAMGLIVGTGCNATVPLRPAQLGQEKYQPLAGGLQSVGLGPGEGVRIAVNTEWSIRGSLEPLAKQKLVTHWDEKLDAFSGLKGFQPLEYMTAGRYLGELARLIFLDYLRHDTVAAKHGEQAETTVSAGAVGYVLEHTKVDTTGPLHPRELLRQYGMDTTWLSHYRPSRDGPSLVELLRTKYPTNPATDGNFSWTEEAAQALYHVARAVERRAAAIVAAAVMGLLRLAGQIPEPRSRAVEIDGAIEVPTKVLGVGYTGGCIANFQDYLRDTQTFLDGIVRRDFEESTPVRVMLTPCHDGGIIGAGILCAAAEALVSAG